MESGQVAKDYKPTRKLLLGGFLLGVLFSFLLLVVIIAFKWGPQGENIQVDLYSGHTIINKHFLWKRWQISEQKNSHVQWAIDHQKVVKSWYCTGSSIGRSEWFGRMMSISFNTRGETVYSIYSLDIPEAEKVKLLHQYHQGLDALKIKQDSEYKKSCDARNDFFTQWDQKLEAIAKDSNQATPPDFVDTGN